MILDSGERRAFTSGAVRDIQEGKGRCDLLPLNEVSLIIGHNAKLQYDPIVRYLAKFTEATEKGERINLLLDVLEIFAGANDWDYPTMILEVSKHFEEGAKKYGEHNWQKGIPTHCYLDSAVRHLLKWERHDADENHANAFVWNILCMMWTINHRPDFDDLTEEGE